jgi:hypothetical protein
MLKFFIFFIASSAIVLGMSVETIFTAVYSTISINSVNISEQLLYIMALLDLQTGIPTNGFHLSNMTDLIHIIREADYLFELGYANINGVLVYAIKIGNLIYSVEPRIFHSLIYLIFSNII